MPAIYHNFSKHFMTFYTKQISNPRAKQLFWRRSWQKNGSKKLPKNPASIHSSFFQALSIDHAHSKFLSQIRRCCKRNESEAPASENQILVIKIKNYSEFEVIIRNTKSLNVFSQGTK